jgi:hypothetical protein
MYTTLSKKPLHVIRLFFAHARILDFVGRRWATVTVMDDEGRRHSVDVQAYSTFDAAHLFVTHAKATPQSGLPRLGADTVFEVIAGGAIHYIKGAALQRWILKERQERKGPAGFLFSQRPTLE